MADDTLYTLLNISPFNNEAIKELDENAIIEELKKIPHLAAEEYEFTVGFTGTSYIGYPLHQALRLKASIDVIRALYESYPQAAREPCTGYGDNIDYTALHIALDYTAPTDVILFILNQWLEAVFKKDIIHNTPLHCACESNASAEIVSQMLKIFPDAARLQNGNGETPLFMALDYRSVSIENVALLINHDVGVLKDKTDEDWIPLHIACLTPVPSAVILHMVEKWPEAILEKDDVWKTPLHIYHENEHSEEDVQEALSHVFKLCNNTVDKDTSKEMLNLFFEMKWWSGIGMIFDQCPSLAKNLDINIKFFSTFLSFIGTRCTLKTIGHVISNELDIMEGIK